VSAGHQHFRFTEEPGVPFLRFWRKGTGVFQGAESGRNGPPFLLARGHGRARPSEGGRASNGGGTPDSPHPRGRIKKPRQLGLQPVAFRTRDTRVWRAKGGRKAKTNEKKNQSSKGAGRSGAEGFLRRGKARQQGGGTHRKTNVGGAHPALVPTKHVVFHGRGKTKQPGG